MRVVQAAPEGLARHVKADLDRARHGIETL
jgi:hypothetical protein